MTTMIYLIYMMTNYYKMSQYEKHKLGSKQSRL